jgi:hypothetical protein
MLNLGVVVDWIGGKGPTPHTHRKEEWMNDFIKEALAEGKRRKDRETELRRAVLEPTAESTKTLRKKLNEDVNVNSTGGSDDSKSEHGWGVIHFLVKGELKLEEKGRLKLQKEKLRLLLKRPDIDLDLQDKDGKTPLHLAADARNVDCTRILLAAGANTEVADAKGHLPRHYAKADDVAVLFDTSTCMINDDSTTSTSEHVSITSFQSDPITSPIPTISTAEQSSHGNLFECLPPEIHGDIEYQLASRFKGCFRCPGDSDGFGCERKPVWDLIYSQNPKDIARRKRKKKWFHLPAASVGRLLLLTRHRHALD